MTNEPDAAVVARLRAAGSVFAEDEAAALVGTARSLQELDELVARRVLGEPLEVVVGWAQFCGLRIRVATGVFVPRTRTTVLVDVAGPLLRAGSVVVDLCCGTGAIGVALHDRQPGIQLHAADIDPVAVACARSNVEPVGGTVLQGDLFEALPAGLRGRVDLLVVNAPYVPTEAIALLPPEAREHEPEAALDGGADGLEVQRRVAAGAGQWLAPGGHLVVETSAGQSALTLATMQEVGLSAHVVSSAEVDGTAVVGTLVPTRSSPAERLRRDTVGGA